jgi:hypothetical protein
MLGRGKREIEKRDRRCIMVTKTFLHKKILLFIAITLITWTPFLPGAFGSILTSSPPTIDGDASEWTLENSTRIPVTNGFVHLMNDATNLYVLIDVTSDTGNDIPVTEDRFWLTFDVSRYGVLEPNVDVNFSPDNTNGTLTLIGSYYTGGEPLFGEPSPMGPGSLAEGFGTSVNDPITPHRIWELKVPRDWIQATDLNSRLRFAFKFVSKNPSFDVETPPEFFLDFSTDFLVDQMDRMAGLIDPRKWANLEFIRRAENGALHSAVKGYESAANNMLLLKDSSGVNSIEAKVTVNAIQDTDYAKSEARIGGFFFNYNDGSKAGDYYAQIYVSDKPGPGWKAYYFVARCLDGLQCLSFDDAHSGSLGLVNIGEAYTLLVGYHTQGTTFAFKFGNNGVDVPLTLPGTSGSANVNWMGIGTRVYGPMDPGSGENGYIDAIFENVTVNGVSKAISDSNGLIDRNTWSDNTLEFVREQITDGVYGLALRSYGSYVNNGLNLKNTQNVEELQADLTVEELGNPPQLNPATPMAALEGNFYNAGGGGLNDQTGDIKALVGIRHNGTQLAAFYNIVKCTKPNCSVYSTDVGSTEYLRIYFHEDPLAIGPDLVGKSHRVSFRYNATSNTFTFGFDGRLTTYPSSSDPLLPDKFKPTPNVARMGPLTRVAFFNGPSGEGSVSAQFANIATVVDTDGDGVPDSADNCPTVYNPIVAQWIGIDGMHSNSQPDFDLDTVGDACDLCPKVFNDGGPCGSETGSGSASLTEGSSLMNVTVTYNGPVPVYLVPPDCNNVIFNSDPPIPQNCRRIPPYVLNVVEGDTPGYGSPGGDWILAKAGDSWTITCDLFEIFDIKAFQAAGAVNITPAYTFFETDRGLDPTGTCARGDICVDTAQYNLFQGTIPTKTVQVQQLNTKLALPVTIDIKPGSPLPKTINVGSHGNVPVAILSYPKGSIPDFDATTVDPTTVKMGAENVRVVGKKGTLQEEISDVNGDGRLDMIVHFDTQALSLSSDAVEVCLEGSTTGGIAFKGCNQIRIVP